MVSFVIDAILIIICIVVITLSFKRGFVKTVLSLVSSIAAVLISVVFTPTVSRMLYDKFMLSAITKGIRSTVNSLSSSDTSEAIAEMLETMPEALSDMLERYKIDAKTVEGLLESAKAGDASVQSISESIASPIASTISNVVAFAGCFIVALIILKILILIIDTVFKLPILNSVNKGAGLLLGAAIAVVIIFVYSESAVQLVNALGAVSPEIFGEKVISDTIIVKFFSEHNIFIMIRDVIERGVVPKS